MSSLSMAMAVWARNCAGAAASREAMPIAATVKYKLALSLMGPLLVHVVFGASRPGHVCSPHALRARPKILHSPCRPAISLVAAALRADSHGGCTPRRRNVEPSAALARGEREGAAAGSAMERHEPKEPSSMVSKLLIIAAAAGLLISTAAHGYREGTTQARAPGQALPAAV